MKSTSKMFKALFGGVILLLGFALVRHVEAAGTWSLTGSMSTARAWADGLNATLLSDGRVLVSGGFNGSYLASAEIYDPALGTWSPTGSMGTARSSHTSTLLPDGRVLVSGGTVNPNSAFASAEIYDPALGTWSLTGSMGTARRILTAAPLPDGRVLVTGGVGPGNSILASAEIYDPALGTWSPTGSMGTARLNHRATLLPDGRVLVSGGACCVFSGIGFASAEIYDPALGTWSPTGSMSTVRYTHTATLLPDGRVLVSGGFNGSCLASAETFDSTQVMELIALIDGLGLQGGTANSLTSKLENAVAQLAIGGNVGAACNMLSAFINQAQAQSGKQLTTDQAAQLIASANQIRAAHGCP